MPAYLVVVRQRQPEVFTRHPLITAAESLDVPIEGVSEERRYVLAGDLREDELARLAGELLVDPVLNETVVCSLDAADDCAPQSSLAMDWAVDVAYRAGVTDNEGESVVVGARHAGITGLAAARTVRRTLLRGEATAADIALLAERVLANDLVEMTAVVHRQDATAAAAFYRRLLVLPAQAPARIATVPLREADDEQLAAISREGILALDLDEMRAIRDYFRTLGRDPTDGELETLAQTWSEHCSHKTFKARIQYRGTESSPIPFADPAAYPMLDHLAAGTATVDGLLKTFLMAATDQVRPPWLLSAFVDNAGIIAFGAGDALSFKVETHNHPSALEPFGGANTGVGGVVRDVLGVSAQPIANVDVLCFGPLDT
ncbi:MAG TPA: AIR synthase related protein, partial [Herpetosiphonaceae bacterium]|nr:AIR synthase related protein [Herpetosiphonaceae bacterium]